VTSNESIRLTSTIASLAIFLAVACGIRPAGGPEAEKTKAIPADIQNQKEKEAPSVSLPARQAESVGHKVKPTRIPSPDPFAGETPRDNADIKIDWGREAALEEIIAMAKSGEIQQIEWHVMPNIIRAQVSDGRIFHIRNENKGIDMRNTLTNAGIHIGKGGISFRHVF
jgi:hypothetical protein